ncbi:envelope-like protein, partial [Trifolium medium]|nr:envelope-like protein [Trifolium medium]
TWSKGVPPSEKKKKSLKRKEVSSSDSEYAVNEDVVATSGATVNGSSKKARTVPFVPVDNVSFHHENSASRWKFVYQRRVTIERNLSNDLLQCQDLVELIDAAGLMKTVKGLGKCY